MKGIFKKTGLLLLGILLPAAVAHAAENYKWEELPKLPTYDFNLTNPLLLSTGDKIMSFGGIDQSNNRLYIYDIKTKTWTDKSTKGFEIFRNGYEEGAVSNNKAYVIPGHNPDNMVIYDPADDSKTLVPNIDIQADTVRGNDGLIFNVLGDDGDCEKLSSWTGYNNSSLSASADNYRIGNRGEYAEAAKTFTSTYMFGKQAIRITPSAEYGGMTINVKDKVDTSKYYLAAGYIRTNGTGTDGAKVVLQDADGNVIGGGSTYQKPTTWKRIGYKIQPSDFSGKNLASIKFGVISKDTDKTLTTLADGLSLIEISAADYTSLSADQLMAKYPYRGNHINFLGADGDVEDIKQWNAFDKSYNDVWASGIIIGSRDVRSFYSGSEYTGIYKNIEDKIDATKYYFASAYKTNAGGTDGVRVVLLDADSNPIGTSSYNANGGDNRIGYKIRPSDFTGKNLSRINFAVQGHDANKSAEFYTDGLMLIEITQDEYNNLSEQQLMDKYPFKKIDSTGRYYGTLTTVYGKLYLIGGYYGDTPTNDSLPKWGDAVWEFDTSTNTWTKTSASLQVIGHMAFNVGGKIYIIGGRKDNSGAGNTSVLEWTPGTNEFILKNPIPVAIDRASDSRWHGVSLNGKIYLRNRATTYVYDPLNDTWDWLEKQDYLDNIANWNIVAGSFAVSSNKLQTVNPPGTQTTIYNEEMSDAQITARVQMLDDGTTVYLPLRSSLDAKNKYFVEITGSTLRLCKTVNDSGYASAEELASVERTIDTTIPHTYNIVLMGDNIGIWEDYKLKIMKKDSTYRSGRMGLGCQDTMVSLQFLHFLKLNENSNLKGNELVSNGTFNTDIQGWTVSGGDENVKWSNNKLVISEQNLSGERSAVQNISIGDAEAVLLRFKASAYNLNTTGGIKYSWKNGQETLTAPVYADSITKNNHKDGWMILTVPEGANTLQIQACVEGTSPQTGYIEFDDISVKKFAPQLTALEATQEYVGLTSANGYIYQFKGYNRILGDVSNFTSSQWNGWDDAKVGVNNEFSTSQKAITLTDETFMSQNIYVIPGVKYKLAFDVRIGTMNRLNKVPMVKISFFDTNNNQLIQSDIDYKYDHINYGRYQVPFVEFTAPENSVYARVEPMLAENDISIDTQAELWVNNPSFDTTISPWSMYLPTNAKATITRDNTTYTSAPASAKIIKTNTGDPGNYVDLTLSTSKGSVEKGKWYKLSFDAKANIPIRIRSMNFYTRYPVWTGCAEKVYFNTQPISTNWRTYNVYFLANKSLDDITIDLYFYNDFDTIWVDSFSLKEANEIELITNPSFDIDSFGWNYYKNASHGAQASASVDTTTFDTAPAAYKLTVTNSGTAETDVYVYSNDLPIEADKWYKLSFRAKANQTFTIPNIKLVKTTDISTSYEAVVENGSPSISTDWQTYEVYFLTTNTMAADARINFNLGKTVPAGCVLYLDTLSFKMTETFAQITNSSFDTGTSGWNIALANGAFAAVSRDTAEYASAPAGMRIECTNKGTASDDIKVYTTEKLTVVNQRLYKLTFKARSTLNFTIPYIRLEKDSDPYTDYTSVRSGDLSLTDSWKTYTIYLRTSATANDARLVFGLGGEMPIGANLYIDDISLQELPYHLMGEMELYTSSGFFANDMELKAPENTTVLDNYLVQGGKVIWAGSTPFEKQGMADGTKTNWENNLLEFEPTDINNNETVSITQDGTNAGIASTWQSKAPVPDGKVNSILSKISTGNAAAWEKNWNAVTPDKFMVRDWVVYGPLTYLEGQDINHDFVGEAEISPFDGMVQGDKIWLKYNYTGDTGDWIDFRALYGDGTGKVAYANAYINSNTDQNLIIKFNTENNIKLFVNGESVQVNNSSAGISLKTGLNRILLKIEGSLSKWYVGVELQKQYIFNPIKDSQVGNSIDNKENWIKDWLVLTGFTPTGTPIDYDYLGGEASISPTEGQVTAGKTWRSFTADYTGTTIYSYGYDVSYAYTNLYSDAACKAVLYWQRDDTIKIWVNGVQVYSGSSNTEIEVNLNQGYNGILVKLYNAKGPGYLRLMQRKYIMDWLTLGYFSPVTDDPTNPYSRMYHDYIGDESTISPSEGDTAGGNTWTRAAAAGNGKVLDSPGSYVMDYAFAEVYCDTDRKAILTTQLRDWALVWVNGEYMGRADYTTNVPINLKKGYNEILIKNYNENTGYVRVYLTTTESVIEKPTGITVLGNSRVGSVIRLYDTNIDGVSATVQQDVYSVLSKVDNNRIVYYDPSCSFTGLIKNKEAIVSFFTSKGFKQKNAAQLKEWMMDRLVKNSVPGTVVVFSQENAPDTIVDTHDANCLLRRYLNAGGKVIWAGEQPLANISTADGNVELGEAGAEAILGIAQKETTDAASVTLTDYLKNLGVTAAGTWKSTRPINPGQGEIPLAETASGDVSGWLRNYNPEYPYSGFIRLFDAPITISDTEKNNMLKLALYDVNTPAVYYDARYGSEWITNPAALKTSLKNKGIAEINADNTDFMKANNYKWKTLVFSQDVVPDTLTRYNESISTNPSSVIVSWVDNSEGESAFVIYANGVKKKTVYSDTSSGTGKSYMAVVEDLEANSTLTVKPAYFHYTEVSSQRSEGDGLNFTVKDAVSKKPGGLRGKTYPDDEELRTTVDLSWEDTSTSELGFEIYVDGELNQTADSTTTESMGKTYSLRFEGLEAGRTYQFGVKNVYATQKSVMAVVDVQLPPANIGTIRLAEVENMTDSWDKEGRGYAVLEWDAVTGATKYGIYLLDGCDYRKVQEVTEPRWDSRQAKVYPSEADLDGYLDNSIPKTASPFKEVGKGEDLRDVPTKLYQKTWGTEYDTKTDYYVKISVINASGEISYPDDKVTFKFNSMTDTTPPTGGIIINKDEGTTKDRVVSVDIVATDKESGLDTIEFSENNATWSPKYPYAPSTNWTLSSGIGDKTLYCRVTDKAGNSAVFSGSIELLTADGTPTIRLTVNNGEDTVRSTAVTLNVVVTDDITAVNNLSIRFSNNNVTWSSWSLCTTTQFPWTLTAGNGRKTVYAEVMDENGNVGRAVVYVRLEPETSTSKVSIISKDATSIVLEDGTYPAVKQRVFEVSINANQDTSEISVSWDGVTWSPWERATVTASGSGFVTVKKKVNFQANEGWNEFYAKTRSTAGAESEIISQKMFIDTKPPVVKLQSAFGSTATSSSSIDLIADVEDNVSEIFSYSVNNKEKAALPEDRKITVNGIEKGKLNLIQVRVYDQAGNSTLASIRIWGL